MIDNTLRTGRFTSSKIFLLMSNGKDKTSIGKPGLTYIAKKNLERRINRSLDGAGYSREMAWGTFLEQRVLDLIGMEYELTSQQTDQHPEIPYWSGSKDLIVRGLKVADIKCYQLENFCGYTDALLTGNTEKIKEEWPQEYWQLVSNAIINNTPNAEAITYCPYRSELGEIRQMAYDYTDLDAWKYRFIYEAPESELANIEDGGYYKNLNKFEFEVPQADKDALTNRVREAGKLLVPFFNKEEIPA